MVVSYNESISFRSCSFDLVHTPAGEKFLEKGDNQGLVFCAFVGKVAVGM